MKTNLFVNKIAAILMSFEIQNPQHINHTIYFMTKRRLIKKGQTSKQTRKHMDIATTRLNRPQGQFSEKKIS